VRASLAGLIVIVGAMAGCTDRGASAAASRDADWYPPEILSRSDLQALVEAGLDRDGEPLARALQAPDPLVRWTAACALASVQKPRLRGELFTLLRDDTEGVRRCAAYGIGLLGPDEAGGTSALLEAIDNEANHDVRIALLEAIGRTGSRSDLQQLLKQAGRDSLLDVGFSHALFHFGRRRITHPAAAPIIKALIADPDEETATIAGLALGASRNIGGWGLDADVVRSALDAMPRNCRAAGPLLAALELEADPTDAERARRWLERADHWTIRVAAARLLGRYGDADPRATEALVRALDDASPHVAVAAAQALARNGTHAGDAVAWEDLTRTHLARPAVAAALLPALAGTGDEPLILAWARGQLNVRPSYAYPALARLATPDADTLLVHGLRGKRRDAYAAASALADRLERTERGDPLRAHVARVLLERLATWGPHAPASDIRGLTRLLQLFATDSAAEARALVERAATHSHLKVRAAAGVHHEMTEDERWSDRQPISWRLLATFGQSPRISLKTTRGTFVVELRPLNAPLGVSTLLEHVAAGRFSDLVFHRVEPDFILQSGDFDNPHGSGGPDRGLRSEFSHLRFSPGVMGIASAGKDTEGSQFFLTHNNAPSLDGRYSAVGRIVSGQDAADAVGLDDAVTVNILPQSPPTGKKR